MSKNTGKNKKTPAPKNAKKKAITSPQKAKASRHIIARILGMLALILAIALIGTGILGSFFRDEGNRFNGIYADALNHQAKNKLHADSASKTAPSAVKKAESAEKQATSAVTAIEASLNNANTLYEGYLAREVSDTLITTLYKAAETISTNMDQLVAANDEAPEDEAVSAFKEKEEAIRNAGKTIEEAALELTYALFKDEYSASIKALNNAEAKMDTAVTGIMDVYKRSDLQWQWERYEKTAGSVPEDIDEFPNAISELLDRARQLQEQSLLLKTEADTALSTANEVTKSDSLSFSETLLLLVGKAYIYVTFTGSILLIAALIMLLIPGKFMYAWKHVPVFSVFITAIVMLIILTYAHGNTLNFEFEGYGDWASKWIMNVLNILRSNASIGMVALGMTFVIITGGIDLAVGSTLAGIATVVMVIIDVPKMPFFESIGLSSTIVYLIAIIAGILLGLILGGLTGLGVTKGRVPPFIVTLGIMNIVRSVAQYFTKSTKIEVPIEFQKLANTTLKDIIQSIANWFGKTDPISFPESIKFLEDAMLLPIIYWIILIIIMYVISKHTAFGRHIYAVGSNERTSRLSGINVDRVKISVYMLMGLIVAIAAITQVARLRGVDVASAGSGYEMSAIAAVVVGGTSMAGGRGSIIGTVLGVLIIGIMDNLVVLLHIDAFLSNAFIGAIIIFAVLMQKKDK